jgi:hypothetical protein
MATASGGVSKQRRGSGMGREPGQTTCAHTTRVEGVVRGERVVGRSCEPSLIELLLL